MYLDENDIREVFEKVIDRFLIKKFDDLGMEASGEWRENLRLVTTNKSATIRGRKYTEQLVHGRRPGTMPPVANIEKWVNVKLGLYGREATSAAWAISRKIEQEGTSWYKQGGTDLLEVLESEEVISYIRKRLGEKINLKIQLEFVRDLKKLEK